MKITLACLLLPLAANASITIDPEFAKQHPGVKIVCSQGISCDGKKAAPVPKVHDNSMMTSTRSTDRGTLVIQSLDGGLSFKATGAYEWIVKPFEICGYDEKKENISQTVGQNDVTTYTLTSGDSFALYNDGRVTCKPR